VLGMQDKLGRIMPGAHADVLVVDGNPLKSVDCLLGQGEHIPLVMKDGRLFVNELESS
jgi:imidazolonepropionase-like amidohydrolase